MMLKNFKDEYGKGFYFMENYKGNSILVGYYTQRGNIQNNLKRIYLGAKKDIREEKQEIDKKNKKLNHKKSLKKFLYRMSKGKDYLTIEEMRKAISLYKDELTYSYDLLGSLGDFKATKKGLKCIDILDNVVYFYPKDSYKFYICNFRGMY